VIVLNKMDLPPHEDFRDAAFEQAAREPNPRVFIFQVSAKRADGGKAIS
jgi:Ni2+-binding GTPase involved in maturation of urease and hydrogenase